jgi:MinD superfamily P-loop ATPase
MYIVHTNCFTIHVIIVINKQTNNSLSINEMCNMDLIKLS